MSIGGDKTDLHQIQRQVVRLINRAEPGSMVRERLTDAAVRIAKLIEAIRREDAANDAKPTSKGDAA